MKKENEALEFGQKILFFLFFWGVNSWGLADSFKTNGYKKKHRDAWRLMKLGMLVFIVIPLLLVVFFVLLR